jgi:hypothetical protein
MELVGGMHQLDLEGSSHCLIKVLCCHFSGGTEENNENLRMSQPRSEDSTSKI